MRFAILSTMILFVLPAVVTACEGDCIVEITNAFLLNYRQPIEEVLGRVALNIMSQLLPDHRYYSPPLHLIDPIVSAYNESAYAGLEHAIFPSFFHGKCLQYDETDSNKPPFVPDGCPNPNCPVVCGTPGSMVHFYPKLRFIAYNQTNHLLHQLTTPGTDSYRALEARMMREAGKRRGDVERRSRNIAHSLGGSRIPRVLWKREQDDKKIIQEQVNMIGPLLRKRCGGSESGTNGLPQCSWEEEMKAFILSFP